MKNLLTIFQPKHERAQDLKNRMLKNREAVLDAFSSKIDNAKCCPLLLMQKCQADMCTLFIELRSTGADGKEVKFWRCSLVEQNLLLIELNTNIRKLTEQLTKEKVG